METLRTHFLIRYGWQPITLVVLRQRLWRDPVTKRVFDLSVALKMQNDRDQTRPLRKSAA
jgi:hypothetical protein